MAEAIKAKDVDPNAVDRATKRQRRKGLKVHTKKTFDQLSGPQKDDLLKQCALKLGLIKLDP